MNYQGKEPVGKKHFSQRSKISSKGYRSSCINMPVFQKPEEEIKKNKIKKIAQTKNQDIFDKKIKNEQSVKTLKKQLKIKSNSKNSNPFLKIDQETKRIQVKSSKKVIKSKSIIHSFSHFKKLQSNSNDFNISKGFRNKLKINKHHEKQAIQENIITKLLNISLLTSQIQNGSLITSQRRQIDRHSKVFKSQYGTFDMRILKGMKDDLMNLEKSDKKDIVWVLMKNNNISLQELTKKIVLIQRRWRKNKNQKSSSKLSQYQKIFNKNTNIFALDKPTKLKIKQQKKLCKPLFNKQATFGKFILLNSHRSLQIRQDNQTNNLLSDGLSERKINQLTELYLESLFLEFAKDIGEILSKISLRNNKPTPQTVKEKSIENGINTSYDYIQKFIEKLIQFILSNLSECKKVLKVINIYLSLDSLTVLQYLRDDDDYSYNDLDSDFDTENDPKEYILSEDLFQKYQQILDDQYYEQNRVKMNAKMNQYYHIWNRCIFQALNQHLNFERPYGIQGKCYDWITQQKRNKIITQENLGLSLQSGLKRLLKHQSSIAGLLFDQQLKSDLLNINKIGHDQKTYVNTELMALLLKEHIYGSENQWINYNDELCQILVQLAKVVYQQLIIQLLQDFQQKIILKKSTSYMANNIKR